MIATDNLIKIKNHNFERFTSFESIQSHAWRLGCVCVEEIPPAKKSQHSRF